MSIKYLIEMTLFEEITKEFIGEAGKYSTQKKTGGVFDTGANPERSYIVFRGEKYPIYSVGEMAEEFRDNYLADEIGEVCGATLSKVMEAYDNGFFKRWIPTQTINKDMAVTGRTNKGDALEFVLGKKKDSKSESDLADTELKSYDEGVYYHTLFNLSPYNYKHRDLRSGRVDVLRGDKAVNDVLYSIKQRIQTKKQDKILGTDKYANYQSMPNKSYAQAIIEIDKAGNSRFNYFYIETIFYDTDENGKPLAIDEIICTYSVEDTEKEILYRGSKGDAKQTISQTIGNKLLTILSFPTISLDMEKENSKLNLKVIPGDTTTYKQFYMWTKPSVHSIREYEGGAKELVFNFIEAINDGDVVINFGFDDNLNMTTRFNIKNSPEAYNRLYQPRDNMRMVPGNDVKMPGSSAEVINPNAQPETDQQNMEQEPMTPNVNAPETQPEPEMPDQEYVESDLTAPEEPMPEPEGEAMTAQDQVKNSYNDNKGFM